MRQRFLCSILLTSLSACTFQVSVLAPDGQTATLPAIEPVSDSSVNPNGFTATPPQLSTLAPISTIPPSPSPGSIGVYPLQFEPNGTYLDTVDSILAGTSKTYSVSALRGQIMSVSVRQPEEGNWAIVPLTIVGADGSTICPLKENTDCYFWRDVLPASQTYYVTLAPAVDVLSLTLRVAINPPSAATQSFQYVSVDQTASFLYTDEFAPVRLPEMYLYKSKPDVTLRLIDTKTQAGTNLVEAYFMFGTSSDIVVVNACYQAPAWVENEEILGEADINGTRFLHGQRGGVATGNQYEMVFYRTVKNSVCYDASYMLHYFSTGNLAPGLDIEEFDRAVVMQKMEALLSTLVIK